MKQRREYFIKLKLRNKRLFDFVEIIKFFFGDTLRTLNLRNYIILKIIITMVSTMTKCNSVFRFICKAYTISSPDIAINSSFIRNNSGFSLYFQKLFNVPQFHPHLNSKFSVVVSLFPCFNETAFNTIRG